jgi:hypothetical protein
VRTLLTAHGGPRLRLYAYPDDLDLVSRDEKGSQVPVWHALSQQPRFDDAIPSHRSEEVNRHPSMGGDHHELSGVRVVDYRTAESRCGLR